MVNIKWLHKKPSVNSGVTWGIPWAKGSLKRKDKICLKDSKGKYQEVQMWPMAYWPDGSIKWSGQAAIFQEKCDDSYTVEAISELREIEEGITIKEKADKIIIDTGSMECIINKSGASIIDKIEKDNKIICKDGKIILINENRKDNNRIYNQYISNIKSVEVEQAGKIRSVIKVKGNHNIGNRDLCAFEIRLVFFKKSDDIKIMHTFFYEGNPKEDFIKGIALEFSLNLTGSEYNRHAAFALEEGVYLEPAKILLSRHYHINNTDYEKQIEGNYIELDKLAEELKLKADENPLWNDFKLIQDNANHYKLIKRCEEDLAYIDVTHGEKSSGLAYIGDEDKGMSIALKDFWQRHPNALEVKDLGKDESKLRVWLWDTSVSAMDLRHYSNTYHMSAYEGFKEMRSTPIGIGNTSEISIKVFAQPVTKQELFELSQENQRDTLLVCNPEYYYGTKACGLWSLPDKSTKLKAFINNQIEKNVDFYRKEIEQRKWYGYWNYGDIMHTYDKVRHQWRYDVGGYAWQNTELVPNIWLWYQFLRTGDKDVFYMAEAMARHTSEVDRYHFGQYKGLGSRHNVVHWGCSCKEVRISMAGLHKIYYYLTCDERMGELLTEVKDVDKTTEILEPIRGYFPDETNKIHLRVGPDWSTFCSNWETEWERTENLEYRDKILKGINYLKKLPFRLLTGPAMVYNPKDSMLEYMGDGNTKGYHMVIAFGAPQVWMEIADLIEDEDWKDMIAEFGAFYALPNEEKIERSHGKLSDKNFAWPMFSAAMVAYAAKRYGSEKLANKAWKLLFDELKTNDNSLLAPKEIHSWQNLMEDETITTNEVSQWSLNAIICLELVSDSLLKK